jgi:hypothetical protein
MRASRSTVAHLVRLGKLAVSLVYHAGDAAGFWLARLSGGRPRPICSILYYHAVEDRERFGRQMDVVRRWTRPISVARPEPMTAGARYSAITFDDGMLSVLENALPELERRRIPCTIFVVPGALGSVPAWLRNPDYYRRSARVMTAQEMLAARSDLVTFGSHTMTHPDLTRVGEAQAYAELRDSKVELERLLGEPVGTFSFPHGAHDDGIVALCRQADRKSVV